MEKRSCIHVLLFLLPTCTVFSQWEMALLEIYKVGKLQTYLWNTSFAMIASTNNGLLFCLMNNVWVAGTIFFFFLLKYIFVKYVLHVIVFHGFCSRKFKVQYKVADGNSYQSGLYHCMYVNFNSPEWIIYTGI